MSNHFENFFRTILIIFGAVIPKANFKSENYIFICKKIVLVYYQA